MGKSSSSSSPKLGKKRVELSLSDNNKRKRTSSTSTTTTTSNCTSSSTASAMDDHEQQQRYPLSEVVSVCTARWFEETLKEAMTGDVNMQIILAQMYYNGYGVPKDPKKGKTWITRASRVRSSVSNISRKHPGYNASDSDSDDIPDS